MNSYGRRLENQILAWFKFNSSIPEQRRTNFIRILLLCAIFLSVDFLFALWFGSDGTTKALNVVLILFMLGASWLLWQRHGRQEVVLLLIFLGTCLYLTLAMTLAILTLPPEQTKNNFLLNLSPWFLWLLVLIAGCFYLFRAATALRLSLCLYALAATGLLIILVTEMPASGITLRDALELLAATGIVLALIYLMANRHEFSSQTDFLTGLPNRMYGYTALQHEIDRVERYQSGFAIILLDLDHFKKINDTYGHPAGDSVLSEFSAFVSDHIRRTDILCRWGGEEFLLILPAGDLASARLKADHLRIQIKNRAFHKHLRITSSFGVTCFYPHDSAKTLLERADSALYHAKANGRNCVITE